MGTVWVSTAALNSLSAYLKVNCMRRSYVSCLLYGYIVHIESARVLNSILMYSLLALLAQYHVLFFRCAKFMYDLYN